MQKILILIYSSTLIFVERREPMRVCHCRDVSDHDIRDAMRRGCDDVEALARALGLGTGCGGCRKYADALMAYWRSLERADDAA